MIVKITFLFLLFFWSNPMEDSKDYLNAGSREFSIQGDWQVLFDGTSTKGWRGFNKDVLPSGWVIENGTLKSEGAGQNSGGDIVYDQDFENFELVLEWKVGKGGNSGIFYHVVEGKKYSAAYENAPEFQLIDNMGYEGQLEDNQSAGADYAMYRPARIDGAVKPAGEWNTAKIVFTGKLVEHWMNGKLVLSFIPWSADWNERKMFGKWKDYPDYGKAKKGMIGLQDHGDPIWFRNIKIRSL